ncbi:MAG: T9SS type A sorting domain-containing protein [Saprospiraceae bacterium]|nr:T9SS type A sorting domain-containing protein [Saprospiraceae bacterium]
MNKIVFTLTAFVLVLTSQAQTLLSVEFIGSETKEALAAQFRDIANNAVDLYKITYTTTDVFNEPDTASGLIVVPRRDEVYSYPRLVFQHGTVASRTDVPSNLKGGYEAGLFFGGLGYVSLLPDFLGLGTSRGLHPYVHATSEASAAIDMLHALDEFAEQVDVIVNDQLFITGYSQGGHAAMALHKAIEDGVADFPVTASAPMSGPYSISGVMRERMTVSEETYFYPAYVHFTIVSYNYVYGLYNDIGEVFKPPYVPLLQQFLDEEINLNGLNDRLISALIQNNGAVVPKLMLQDSIISAVLSDEMHPMNIALRDNDVFDWTPQAPTRLYYCMADDQVPFENSVEAANAIGANNAPNFDAIDVNMAADHGECVEPAIIATALFFGQFWDVSLVANREPIPSRLIPAFPNPTAGLVQLEGVTDIAAIEVYNAQGQRLSVQVLPSNTNQIDLSAYPAGTYTVKFLLPEGVGVSRVVKE